MLHTGIVMSAIIFQDRFATGKRGDLQNGFAWTTHSKNVYVDKDPLTGISTIPYSDKYSLGFTYRAKPDDQDATAQQRFTLGTPRPDIWFSYFVRIPDNFYHRTQRSGTNNKWFALWTDKYSGFGTQVVLEYWPDLTGGSTLAYHWRANGVSSPHQGRASFITPDNRGKWMHFVYHVKLATGPDSHDGIIQTWVKKEGAQDYAMLHNRTDAPLFTPGGTNGFTQGYVMGWSNSGFAEETSFYIDDFVVSTSPLISPPIPPVLEVR